MAKSKKSPAAPVVDTQVTELVEKNKKIGSWLIASLYVLRREFVKNLTSKQFNSAAGAQVIEALKAIEEKSPATPCTKCSQTGLFYSTYHGSYSVCYDCIFGRVLGHPGMQHAVDRKVTESYRGENRFEKQDRQPAWHISDEEIAKHKAATSKPKQTNEADIAF